MSTDQSDHMRLMASTLRDVWRLAEGWARDDDTEPLASDIFTAFSALLAWEAERGVPHLPVDEGLLRREESVSGHQGPPDILTWDYREQPDLDVLAEMVRRWSGGTVRISEIPTGDDSYAIVITNREISLEDAQGIYRQEADHG